MIYFIELWNANENWLSLEKSDRQIYLEQVGQAIQGLTEQGVEILTWSVNDSETDQRGDFNYFAIWKFPNQELAKTFQEAVQGANWYHYFDQVNLKGKEDTVQNVLSELINL